MAKGPTTNKHHCPGASGWVGDESPGGCVASAKGRQAYCTKHQMPCRQGCRDSPHLKNQDGCVKCQARWKAEARRDKETKDNLKRAEQSEEESSFWNPGKDRKKQK
jgi:hypothetical protein